MSCEQKQTIRVTAYCLLIAVNEIKVFKIGLVVLCLADYSPNYYLRYFHGMILSFYNPLKYGPLPVRSGFYVLSSATYDRDNIF